jgi:hypothetical protein
MRENQIKDSENIWHTSSQQALSSPFLSPGRRRLAVQIGFSGRISPTDEFLHKEQRGRLIVRSRGRSNAIEGGCSGAG